MNFAFYYRNAIYRSVWCRERNSSVFI